MHTCIRSDECKRVLEATPERPEAAQILPYLHTYIHTYIHICIQNIQSDVCKRVLQATLERPEAAQVSNIKLEEPTVPGQKCPDLSSVIRALDEDAAGIFRSCV
jgi:hypothetical protein